MDHARPHPVGGGFRRAGPFPPMDRPWPGMNGRPLRGHVHRSPANRVAVGGRPGIGAPRLIPVPGL